MSAKKMSVRTDKAPEPLGPYSQGIVCGDLVFTAQIGLDPQTKKLAGGDIQSQTRQTIENLHAVLQAAGSGLDKVVKTTVFLKNIDDFKAMNEVYARYFTDCPPARCTVQAARLPADALIEIECIAHK